MTANGDARSEAAKKVLFGSDATSGPAAGTAHEGRFPPQEPRLGTGPDTAADDLVKLVLALVETLRQLMERQAVRRVESGALSDDEIERLGLTLLRLEDRMGELRSHFGLTDADLSLRLGTVQDLMDTLRDDEPSRGGGTDA